MSKNNDESEAQTPVSVEAQEADPPEVDAEELTEETEDLDELEPDTIETTIVTEQDRMIRRSEDIL